MVGDLFVMTSQRTRNMVGGLSVILLAAMLVDWSGASPTRIAQRPHEQEELKAGGRRNSAESQSQSYRSRQFPAYAESDMDTLANLLPGGKAAFSPLSVAIWRDYLSAHNGTSLPDPGTAYVKSLSSDGEGGFRVDFVIDGRESRSHLPASLFSADYFRGIAVDNRLLPYSLWSWTDSFDVDPDAPLANGRTDGPSYYDYFDINGWQAGGAVVGNFRGFMTYGVRTLPENLPPGSETYEGIMQGEVWSADNWQWGSRTPVEGDVRLEVNFDKGEITGNIYALRVRIRGARRFQPLPEGNSLNIANSPFAGARMAAAWVGNDPNKRAALPETFHGFRGTLTGEFYGPSAEEVGGVLSGRLAPTANSPEQFLIGSFGSLHRKPRD